MLTIWLVLRCYIAVERICIYLLISIVIGGFFNVFIYVNAFCLNFHFFLIWFFLFYLVRYLVQLTLYTFLFIFNLNHFFCSLSILPCFIFWLVSFFNYYFLNFITSWWPLCHCYIIHLSLNQVYLWYLFYIRTLLFNFRSFILAFVHSILIIYTVFLFRLYCFLPLILMFIKLCSMERFAQLWLFCEIF